MAVRGEGTHGKKHTAAYRADEVAPEGICYRYSIAFKLLFIPLLFVCLINVALFRNFGLSVGKMEYLDPFLIPDGWERDNRLRRSSRKR